MPVLGRDAVRRICFSVCWLYPCMNYSFRCENACTSWSPVVYSRTWYFLWVWRHDPSIHSTVAFNCPNSVSSARAAQALSTVWATRDNRDGRAIWTPTEERTKGDHSSGGICRCIYGHLPEQPQLQRDGDVRRDGSCPYYALVAVVFSDLCNLPRWPRFQLCFHDGKLLGRDFSQHCHVWICFRLNKWYKCSSSFGVLYVNCTQLRNL